MKTATMATAMMKWSFGSFLVPKNRLLMLSSQRNNMKRLCRPTIRSFSSHSNSDALVLVDVEVETGVATLTLNRPPANSLSLEMCQALSDAIQKVESNKSIQGLVLSSSLSSIFCAGLDLNEVYQPDPDRLASFWTSFQQVYIDLYGSRLACMAAINGHAPAGGCMLALSCDYRIMEDDVSKAAKSIGLNESSFGLMLQPWMGQQYIDTLGHRRAELAMSLGTLYNPQEALDIGLVDCVVETNSTDHPVTTATTGLDHSGNDGTDHGTAVSDVPPVVAKAKEVVLQWIRIPPHARVASKRFARQRQIDQLIQTRKADTEEFCAFVTQERVQNNLGAYLESIKKRKKKPTS